MAWTRSRNTPSNLAAGDHDLEVTSCWGGADESYPEDGVAPCGTEGLGGGVNNRLATATVTIVEPEAVLTVSPGAAEPGDTITVRGSGFRMGAEASFIYTSTIAIGGVAIGKVSSVDLAFGYLHAARPSVAEHIDIDPANTMPDGAFVADFVLPFNISAGDHELKVTSCWGGADESYPEDGVAPYGTVGLGGAVNDRVATATITVK